VTPAELLEIAARQPEHSPQRALYIAAAVEQALGREVVVVGGAAVNTWTGEYQPTDLDLIAGDVGSAERDLLRRLGFYHPGVGHRHLSLPMGEGEAPVLVEFPPGPVQAERIERIHLPEGVDVGVISLDDLVMDRLRQATDGTAVTRDDAVALVVAAYGAIDWDLVHRRVSKERAALPELPDTLLTVQRRARQALRRSSSVPPTAGRDPLRRSSSVPPQGGRDPLRSSG
jgi:hypothetical protein